METDVGLVADFGLEFGRIGVGLVHVAGLHREELLFGLLAEGLLDFGDEVHKLHGVGAADVVHPVAEAVLVGGGLVDDTADSAFDDVVDEGEVANHIAAVEHFDGLTLADCGCEEHRAHIGAAPGSVHREEPQAGHRDAVELAVGVGHQFVGFLCRGVEAHGVVHLVVFAVGDFGVESIDAGGGGVDEMPHAVIPAGLEDIEEAHEVALEVGIGVGDGVAHAGLGREIDDLVELFRLEQGVQGSLIGYVHTPEAAVCEDGALLGRAAFDGGAVGKAAFGEAPVLEAHVVVVVDIVDAPDLLPAGGEGPHQLRAYESGGAGHENFHWYLIFACSYVSRLPMSNRPAGIFQAWISVRSTR